MRFLIFFVCFGLISIFTFTDAGWFQQHSGTTRLNDIDFPPGNTNTGYACGDSSFLLKTTDSGNNWEIIGAVRAGDFHAVDLPVNEWICYIACDSGNVAKTDDGGITWQEYNVETSNNLYGIHFPHNTDSGYVAGVGGVIKKTTDGGRSWDDISFPPNDFYDIYFTSEERGWAVGESGTIVHTIDAGLHWETQNSNVSSTLYDIFFLDTLNGWVVGTSRTCLKTSNGGQNWETVNLPFSPSTILYSVIFPVDLTTGFVCGSSGGIAKTTNSGGSWIITNLVQNNFYQVEFPADDQIGWICGQNEVIYKTTDGGAPAIEEPNLNQVTDEKVFSCTPNPFHSKTVIKFPYPLNGQRILKIYDCAGALVRTLALDKQGIINWNGRNEQNQRVKSGVYLLEAITNGISCPRLKLVVLD